MSEQNETKTVEVGGEVGASGEQRVEFGQARPGLPPQGFPDGPGVDMYGDAIEYAPEDPAQRTGHQNEVPPPDSGDPYAPGPKGE